MDKVLKAELYYRLKGDKEQLKKWVMNLDISVKDYENIVGEKLDNIPLDILKSNMLREIDTYKHECAAWFEYDGHQQRFLEFDRVTMIDSQTGLEKGAISKIEWKYPDSYVTITDPNYFLLMRLAGGKHLFQCFQAEKLVKDDIDSILAEEDLNLYDWKVKFEVYLNNIKEGVV